MDFDNDGVSNEFDVDDDNDGLLDEIKDSLASEAEGNISTPSLRKTELPDSDSDGSPNSRDIDSDNDGLTDLFESRRLAPDLNGDGMIDGPVDRNGLPVEWVEELVDFVGATESNSNGTFDPLFNWIPDGEVPQIRRFPDGGFQTHYTNGTRVVVRKGVNGKPSAVMTNPRHSPLTFDVAVDNSSTLRVGGFSFKFPAVENPNDGLRPIITPAASYNEIYPEYSDEQKQQMLDRWNQREEINISSQRPGGNNSLSQTTNDLGLAVGSAGMVLTGLTITSPLGAVAAALGAFSTAVAIVNRFGDDINEFLDNEQSFFDRLICGQSPDGGNIGCLWGDPHLATLDGLNYAFQATGEFTLARSIDRNFVVQTRFEQLGNTAVTVNRATAVKLGTHEFSLYERNTIFMVDGIDVASGLSSITFPEGTRSRFDFEDGVTVLREQAREGTSATYIFVHVDGTRVRVDRTGYKVEIVTPYSHAMEGLLGNYDGDPNNDLVTADGVPVGNGISLYSQYADSWRITDEESMFVYADGENTGTYSVFVEPELVSIDDFPAPDVQEARDLCSNSGVVDGAILNSCIFDFLVSDGDQEFVDSAASVAAPATAAGPNGELDNQATITGPVQANVGEEIAIYWTGPAGTNDTITLSLPNDNESAINAFFAATDDTGAGSGILTMPQAEGTYEVRYRQGGGYVLARHLLSVENVSDDFSTAQSYINHPLVAAGLQASADQGFPISLLTSNSPPDLPNYIVDLAGQSSQVISGTDIEYPIETTFDVLRDAYGIETRFDRVGEGEFNLASVRFLNNSPLGFRSGSGLLHGNGDSFTTYSRSNYTCIEEGTDYTENFITIRTGTLDDRGWIVNTREFNVLIGTEGTPSETCQNRTFVSETGDWYVRNLPAQQPVQVDELQYMCVIDGQGFVPDTSEVCRLP